MIYYYEVAVNTPFNNSILTYKSETKFGRGDLLWVPLGNRKAKGCILSLISNYEDGEIELKEIVGKYDLDFVLDENYLSFITWCSKYYHYPLGQHIFDVLPKPLKRPRDLEVLQGRGDSFEYELSLSQVEAIKKITSSFNNFNKLLLHGVTGSGKTSVYIELLRKVFINKKNALLLIPEINLTPGLLKVLSDHLECKIYSYHSAITASQKMGIWNKLIGENEPFVLVGVRSSIFLPIKNLGLIIVDEEHDGSYKQDDRCPYNARDMAVKLANINQCPVLLGSATPSLETYHWAISDLEKYIELKTRPNQISMPSITIRDCRGAQDDEGYWPFNSESLSEINKRLDNNEKVVIFVNRLGFSNYVQCRSCGHQFDCKNCSLSLKFFKKKNELKCPTCDYRERVPKSCPECGNMKLLNKGFGTERLEEVIKKEIITARVGRFDRDVIKTFKQVNEVLDKFSCGDFNVLIGTQMLSKGHNFKDVNYVLVMGIDSQLNFPDFRSGENAFQLITQISGRSGRYSGDGEVVIDSYCPENKILKQIKNYDLKEFYKEELQIREMLSFPPFSKLCALYLTGKNKNEVANYSMSLADSAKVIKEKHFTKVDILGVRPAIVEKRENKYSWTILFRSIDVNQLHNFINTLSNNMNKPYSISYKFDVDPRTLN